MKKALLFLFTICSLFTKAQEIKYSELSAAVKGDYTSYVASDGGIYKIGDRIKIGVPSSNKTFAYIWQGDGIITPVTSLGAILSGTESEIKRIFVVGNKRTGYHITMRTKGFNGIMNYTIQFENALQTGEIKGTGMTSDEALSAMKKAKDKLDLGLITPDEFEKIKTDLKPFIK